MKILAVDTSTLVLSVAVLDEQKVLGEKTTNLQKNHSIRLMPAIDELLQNLELSLSDMDLLAVTKGPGSYTGVRIGVTTMKTFAWAIGKPYIGISTLAVLAMNGVHFPGLIVPLLNARRDQVYTAIYQAESGALRAQLPEQLMPVETLLEQLQQQTQSVLFLGDNVTLFAIEIQQMLGEQAVLAPLAFNFPQASKLGYLALERWKQSSRGENADFAPDYLQLTLAEKNLLGRLT
jgi:tRNA threonylcarbamoyladenosine biosynthesis protein TsaB